MVENSSPALSGMQADCLLVGRAIFSEKKEEGEMQKESLSQCPYCGKRMCGALTGSTVCEPDGYRSAYSRQEADALVMDWQYAVSPERIRG